MVKRIITWNTQGEGLANDEKKQELIDLIRYSVDDENIEPIIFLQEAGELEGLKKKEWYIMEKLRYTLIIVCINCHHIVLQNMKRNNKEEIIVVH